MNDVLNIALSEGNHIPQLLPQLTEPGSYDAQLADTQKLILSLSGITAVWLPKQSPTQCQYHQMEQQLRALPEDKTQHGQFMFIADNMPELVIQSHLAQLPLEARQ